MKMAEDNDITEALAGMSKEVITELMNEIPTLLETGDMFIERYPDGAKIGLISGVENEKANNIQALTLLIAQICAACAADAGDRYLNAFPDKIRSKVKSLSPFIQKNKQFPLLFYKMTRQEQLIFPIEYRKLRLESKCLKKGASFLEISLLVKSSDEDEDRFTFEIDRTELKLLIRELQELSDVVGDT
jgi:hypothetical protein